MIDVESSASALYDGGWRYSDKEQLTKEYNLSDDDAAKLCEILKLYEKLSILEPIECDLK